MTNDEIEKRFERAPDWPTAVCAMRDMLLGQTSEEEGENPRARGLALLKDTPGETILTVLLEYEVTIERSGISKYTGAKLEFSLPGFHFVVLRKAFECLRADRVARSDLEAIAVAERELGAARERFGEAIARLPPEMRKRRDP